MDTKPLLFKLLSLLSLSTIVSRDLACYKYNKLIVYTRDQLLAFFSMVMLTGERSDVFCELRWRK